MYLLLCWTHLKKQKIIITNIGIKKEAGREPCIIQQGWTSVEVAGKIMDKIGPILATKYLEIN
jgi:hypothetical protein